MSAIQEFANLINEEPEGGNIFGDAYRGVARKAKTLGKSALDLKDKIVKPIIKTRQKVVRGTSNVVIGKKATRRIERYGDAVLYNTAGLPPSVKETLRAHGDEPISKIVIVRTPVQKLMPSIMNAVSLGSFNKKFGRLPYDDLFHLALFVTTSSGVYAIEKNEVIGITHNPADRAGSEYEEVSPIIQGTTMNTLMTGSEKIQGKTWTKYDAYNNNCQDFVMSLLKGSNMGSPQDYAFVKQNTDSLFKNDTFLRKFARNITNVGASVATAISGVDDKPYKSTASTTSFEIPTAQETDVKDGAGRAKKPKKKVEKSQPTITSAVEAQNTAAYLAANPSLFTRVQMLLAAHERGELDANMNPINPSSEPPTEPSSPYSPTGGSGKKRKKGGDDEPYTAEDLEVASYLDPPAAYANWNKLTKAERDDYLKHTGNRLPTPPRNISFEKMLEDSREQLRQKIRKTGSGRTNMSPARKKAVIKEALEFLDGDLFKGFARDTNYYLRRGSTVR